MAYDNTGRAAAARRTRAAVLGAARDSFLGNGWAGTTIRGVAEAAGVSPETVYKTFRSKAGLLKAVYDVVLAGDDEPVPIADRPEGRAVREARTPAEAAVAYAALAGTLAERTQPLARVLHGARGGDPELAAHAAAVDAERLAGATAVTGHWAGLGWLRVPRERARDLVWTYTAPAVHELLGQRGWDRAGYEAWLADLLRLTVLRD